MLPTGLAILDQEAEALFVNDNFFKLTSNKSHKSFRAWPESIHPDDYERVMTEYREAFSKREGVQTEFRCLIGEQPAPWRLFLMRPLSEEADNKGFIVAVIDITDLKAAELSQRKAAEEAKDRKEQQERFVDMISHEIRHVIMA
jgi:PAS domain-containing protein